MNSVYLIEIWDPHCKRWSPMAFDWYDEETGAEELAVIRKVNKDTKARLMQYIPITQAANEVKRQQEARAQSKPHSQQHSEGQKP